MIGRVALALLAVSLVAGAAEMPRPETYRAAADEGRTGEIEGRAYAERRTPDAADAPLSGMVVTLVPMSHGLVAESEEIKAHARDSLRSYREAAGRVKLLQQGYEWALWRQGAGDLLLSSTVGGDGSFAFGRVPAGQWLLIGRREQATAVKPRKREGKVPFDLSPQMVGYSTASFWLVPVTVAAGLTTIVDLTDRNAWYTGVIERLQGPRLPSVLRRPGAR